jgi:hypothetical protein
MSVRLPRLSLLSIFVSALALAAIFAPAGRTRTNTTPLPTVYFVYTMDCTFSILDDSGKPITSIAPGNYQIDVRTPVTFGAVPLSSTGHTDPSDFTACKGFAQFQLTGPGINYFTTMTAGCQQEVTTPVTFQPSSTYTAQDNNQPLVAHGSFTTLATGTPTTPTVTFGNGPTKNQTSTDIVGSDLKGVKGKLIAGLSSAGKPTLLSGGKPVTSLPAGRYQFVITDRDSQGAFNVLGPKMGAPINLTGVKFVGQKTVAVKLAAGKWWFFTGMTKISSFTVTGSAAT